MWFFFVSAKIFGIMSIYHKSDIYLHNYLHQNSNLTNKVSLIDFFYTRIDVEVSQCFKGFF